MRAQGHGSFKICCAARKGTPQAALCFCFVIHRNAPLHSHVCSLDCPPQLHKVDQVEHLRRLDFCRVRSVSFYLFTVSHNISWKRLRRQTVRYIDYSLSLNFGKRCRPNKGGFTLRKRANINTNKCSTALCSTTKKGVSNEKKASPPPPFPLHFFFVGNCSRRRYSCNKIRQKELLSTFYVCVR